MFYKILYKLVVKIIRGCQPFAGLQSCLCLLVCCVWCLYCLSPPCLSPLGYLGHARAGPRQWEEATHLWHFLNLPSRRCSGMSLRQPRPPRTAAGLRQPAPGQLVKEPQGENAIPDSTSWSPSARKTEAGQNRGLIRDWGATDPHSSIIRHALLWTEPRERPAERPSCRLHGPASSRAASL